MTDPNIENETVRISSGNLRNSLNIIKEKSEKGILREDSLDVLNYVSRQISLKMKNSDSSNVSLLYQYNSLPSFVKYFSLSETLKNSFYNLEELLNGVVFLVNPCRTLLKECEWNYSETKNSNESVQVENEMNISHIMRFLKIFIAKSQNSLPQIRVYRFDTGKNTKLVTDFSNCPADNLNDKLQICRNVLLSSALSYAKAGINTIPQINEALSRLHNHENNHIGKLQGKNFAYFVRIIVLTSSSNRNIDSEMYDSVMSCYNNLKNKTRAGIVNFMLMENDYIFSNLSPEDSLLKFSDINYANISLNQSTDKIKVLCDFYEGIESEIKGLSDTILDYGKSFFDPENFNENKKKSKLNENSGIITEFVKKIDSEFKIFSDLVEAVFKNISEYRKTGNRKDVVQKSIEKLEEVSKENLISIIIDRLQKSLQRFYEDKTVKERILIDIQNQIKVFYDSVRRLEKKIRPEGKNLILKFRFKVFLLEGEN